MQELDPCRNLSGLKTEDTQCVRKPKLGDLSQLRRIWRRWESETEEVSSRTEKYGEQFI